MKVKAALGIIFIDSSCSKQFNHSSQKHAFSNCHFFFQHLKDLKRQKSDLRHNKKACWENERGLSHCEVVKLEKR